MSSEGEKTFTRAEVAKHNTNKDTWLLIHNNVYDVSAFLNEVSTLARQKKNNNNSVVHVEIRARALASALALYSLLSRRGENLSSYHRHLAFIAWLSSAEMYNWGICTNFYLLRVNEYYMVKHEQSHLGLYFDLWSLADLLIFIVSFVRTNVSIGYTKQFAYFRNVHVYIHRFDIFIFALLTKGASAQCKFVSIINGNRAKVKQNLVLATFTFRLSTQLHFLM